MSQSFHPLVRDPRELWAETQAIVRERQRQLDLISDVCRCKRPVKGPSYLKVTRCVCCTRKVS